MTRNRYETSAGVSMRKSFAVAGLSLLFACAGTEPTPALTVTPSGSQTIHGPTAVSASEPDVAWSLSGTGTLSGTTGQQVIFHPPTGTASTKVIATAADGRTANVTFNFSAPTSTIPGGQIPNGLGAQATVTYDEQGIPHIFCATVSDCFAVQGFLHAQDRLFEMDLFRRTAEGTLSTLIGSAEVGSDKQFLTLFTTRDCVLGASGGVCQSVADKMAAAIDPASKAKLDAYVSGVNAYLAFLRANPVLMPGEYAQISAAITPNDIPNWTELDSFFIGRLQQFQLSESIEEETSYGLIAQVFGSSSPGRVGAYIHAIQPIQDFTLSATDPAAQIAPPQPVQTANMAAYLPGLAQLNAQMREMHEMFGTQRLGAGSNNWVVDGAHSANGKALVANDPHLQLLYPPLFHLSTMTSADGAIDMAGGSFPGVPGALVGRGQHVGWGVTVVGYDVTDLYLEQVDPTCGGLNLPVPCVIFNGAPVPMTPVQKTIHVRGGADVQFTYLIVPHHGPVISFNPASPTTAISMRWTGHEATNDFLGFFGLATATGVGTTTDPATAKTAFGALRNYAVGAQNFVLADDQGNIGYDPHAFVPKRPWASNTTVGLMPWLPVTGTGPAEWGDGVHPCAAATPDPACWVDDAQLPQAVNPTKGYLATANSDPAGTTADNDPISNSNVPGNPPYLSFDYDDPTAVRYARIASLLAKKTANGGKVSMQDMQDIQSDHTIQLADLFLKSAHFADNVPTTGTGGSTIALGMLTAWKSRGYDCPTGLTGTSPSSALSTDPNVVANSATCLLFHQFLKTLLTNVFNDDFARVAKLAGQNPGGDSGREIRAMLFMLQQPVPPTGPLDFTEFCNNIDPATGNIVTAHTCADQVNIALGQAFNAVAGQLGPPPAANATTTTWVWGKFHTLTTLSPASPLVAGGFQAGPFARPGGELSVDVGNPDGAQLTPLAFTYSHGSNVRFIGEIESPTSANVLMQLPGLEHDAPFQSSPNFPDLLTPYAANQYFNYLMNHQVDSHAVSTQGFAP
jgi:penicillin amidase